MNWAVFAYAGAAAAAGAAALSARACLRETGRERSARALLAAAAAVWAAGGLARAAGAGGRPLVAAAAIGAALLALAALRRVPGAPPHLSGQARTLVDGLIVAGSALLVAWSLGVDDLYGGGHGEAAVVAAALAGLVVAAVAIVLWTRARQAARPRLGLLAGGFTALAVADCARAYLALGGSQPVEVLLAGWAAGWALIGLAAWRRRPVDLGDELSPGLPNRASVVIPSVPFALAILAFAGAAARGRLDAVLIWDAAIVMALIVARQILALLENISFWRVLEAKVKSRTAELEHSEARFRSLVQNSSDVITVIGDDGRVRYESPSTAGVLGTLLADRDGSPLEVVHPEDRATVSAAARELGTKLGSTTIVEFRALHRDGTWRSVEAFAANLLDDEAVAGFVVNSRDITERKALEDQLTHRAFHDPLTGLANRALFANRLDHAIGRSLRHGLAIAVLFLDLDDFKDVNDRLGHGAGDELLNAVAQRLDETVRPLDTVARLGGDEFAMLLDELEDVLDVGHVAERVLAALEPPFMLDGRQVFVRGSIGIATATGPGVTADDLLRNADVAMYTAKSRGKGGYEMFESSMHAALVERLDLENDLRDALEREEFELHYQPIVSLPGHEVVGVEALVRWNHPEHGMVSPARFITVAEQAGLIVPIGTWVLHRACRQAREWRERFGDGLRMNVNLSARQLQDSGVQAEVAAALEESGLDPHDLVLEITESLVVENGEAAIERLTRLKDLGVRLAVDDFGTGYSSLSYLRNLPVDILKVDRAFVSGLEPGGDENPLTQAIVAMGHSLDLLVVGEGVEEAPQAEALAQMGCDFAQGYHFSRPVPADELEKWLEARLELAEISSVGLLAAKPEPVADGVWRIRGGLPRRIVAAYLIAHGGQATAYDAGLRGMGRALCQAAAPWGGLARVVLSHAHPDHRGGAPGAGVPVLCHPAERADAERAGLPPYWDFARLPTRAARWRTPALMRVADAGPVEIAGSLGDGDEVAGFRVVHLPGHAPGLIALWREHDRLALCSDAFTNVAGELALPKAAYTLDPERARKSVRKLAALEPAAAWPAHGPPLRGDVRGALEDLAG